MLNVVRGEQTLYDEKEIEDSLEFLKDIELYEKCRADNIVDFMGLRGIVRDADVTWYDMSRYGIRHDGIMRDGVMRDAGMYGDISRHGRLRENGEHAESVTRVEYGISSEKREYMPYDDNAAETRSRPDEVKKCLRWSVTDFVFIAVCIVISVTLSYVFTHYIAHHTQVEGSSMNDTLNNGDYLIVERVSYYMHNPERYDIIVFPYSENVNYIKRIIGMPGEKIQIIDGQVYINDNLLADDIYGKEPVEDPGVAYEPVYLSGDEYFVMGDNRNSSIDSRSGYVGAVKRDKIEGKAVYRFWPFADFGKIE